MPTTDKNKDGGHSHPQKADKNQNDKGDARKGSEGKGDEKKESFGPSGAKDSH